MINEGEFRFTYFTDKYIETLEFYEHKLGFGIESSWDRSDYDKGSLIKAGSGLIEVMLLPNKKELRYAGLDHRKPQGAFMCIQVWDIDDLFEKYKSAGVRFEQEITDQSWGHRSFSVLEPNELVLFFFQEQIQS